MAVTVADVTGRQSVGNYFEKLVDVTFDASYPTGGEALSANALGFGTILSVNAETVQGSDVRSVAYDRTSGLLLAYAPGGAEVSDTTSLATVTVRLLVRGRG